MQQNIHSLRSDTTSLSTLQNSLLEKREQDDVSLEINSLLDTLSVTHHETRAKVFAVLHRLDTTDKSKWALRLIKARMGYLITNNLEQWEGLSGNVALRLIRKGNEEQMIQVLQNLRIFIDMDAIEIALLLIEKNKAKLILQFLPFEIIDTCIEAGYGELLAKNLQFFDHHEMKIGAKLLIKGIKINKELEKRIRQRNFAVEEARYPLKKRKVFQEAESFIIDNWDKYLFISARDKGKGIDSRFTLNSGLNELSEIEIFELLQIFFPDRDEMQVSGQNELFIARKKGDKYEFYDMDENPINVKNSDIRIADIFSSAYFSRSIEVHTDPDDEKNRSKARYYLKSKQRLLCHNDFGMENGIYEIHPFLREISSAFQVLEYKIEYFLRDCINPYNLSAQDIRIIVQSIESNKIENRIRFDFEKLLKKTNFWSTNKPIDDYKNADYYYQLLSSRLIRESDTSDSTIDYFYFDGVPVINSYNAKQNILQCLHEELKNYLANEAIKHSDEEIQDAYSSNKFPFSPHNFKSFHDYRLYDFLLILGVEKAKDIAGENWQTAGDEYNNLSFSKIMWGFSILKQIGYDFNRFDASRIRRDCFLANSLKYHGFFHHLKKNNKGDVAPWEDSLSEIKYCDYRVFSRGVKIYQVAKMVHKYLSPEEEDFFIGESKWENYDIYDLDISFREIVSFFDKIRKIMFFSDNDSIIGVLQTDAQEGQLLQKYKNNSYKHIQHAQSFEDLLKSKSDNQPRVFLTNLAEFTQYSWCTAEFFQAQAGKESGTFMTEYLKGAYSSMKCVTDEAVRIVSEIHPSTFLKNLTGFTQYSWCSSAFIQMIVEDGWSGTFVTAYLEGKYDNLKCVTDELVRIAVTISMEDDYNDENETEDGQRIFFKNLSRFTHFSWCNNRFIESIVERSGFARGYLLQEYVKGSCDNLDCVTDKAIKIATNWGYTFLENLPKFVHFSWCNAKFVEERANDYRVTFLREYLKGTYDGLKCVTDEIIRVVIVNSKLDSSNDAAGLFAENLSKFTHFSWCTIEFIRLRMIENNNRFLMNLSQFTHFPWCTESFVNDRVAKNSYAFMCSYLKGKYTNIECITDESVRIATEGEPAIFFENLSKFTHFPWCTAEFVNKQAHKASRAFMKQYIQDTYKNIKCVTDETFRIAAKNQPETFLKKFLDFIDLPWIDTEFEISCNFKIYVHKFNSSSLSREEVISKYAAINIMELEKNRDIFPFYMLKEILYEGAFQENPQLKRKYWGRSIDALMRSFDCPQYTSESLGKFSNGGFLNNTKVCEEIRDECINIGIASGKYAVELLGLFDNELDLDCEEGYKNPSELLREVTFIRKIVERSGQEQSLSNIKAYFKIRNKTGTSLTPKTQSLIEAYLGIGSSALQEKESGKIISLKVLDETIFEEFEQVDDKLEFILKLKQLQTSLVFSEIHIKPEWCSQSLFLYLVSSLTGSTVENAQRFVSQHQSYYETLPPCEMQPGIIQVTEKVQDHDNEKKLSEDEIAKIRPYTQLIAGCFGEDSNQQKSIKAPEEFVSEQKTRLIELFEQMFDEHQQKLICLYEENNLTNAESLQNLQERLKYADEKDQAEIRKKIKLYKKHIMSLQKRIETLKKVIAVLNNQAKIDKKIETPQDLMFILAYFMETNSFIKENFKAKEVLQQIKVYFRVQYYFTSQNADEETRQILMRFTGKESQYNANELAILYEFYVEMFDNTLLPYFNETGNNGENFPLLSALQEFFGNKRQPAIMDQLKKILEGKKKNTRQYASIQNAYKKLQTGNESQIKRTLLLIPHKDCLAELAGYTANACYTRMGTYLKDYPDIISYFMLDITDISPSLEDTRELNLQSLFDRNNIQVNKFEGSALFAETVSTGNEPVLIIRADNPQDPVMNKLMGRDYLSSMDAFAKAEFERLLRSRGYKGKFYIVRPNNSGSISNRPAIRTAIELYFQKNTRVLPLGRGFRFNGYDDTNCCHVVAEGVIQ